MYKKQIFTLIFIFIVTTIFAQNHKPLILPVSKTQKKCYNSINEAIHAAPEHATHPIIIFIKNGIYNEKVLIDRPYIYLVGEDRDSTRIIFAELNGKQQIKEIYGKPVHSGTIYLNENANNCIITRLTAYNNYGSTVESTTAHQMTIYGEATRTIIFNCNIFSDGNDDVSLWKKDGGYYYHADSYFRCPGVDFVCPRGWCYATRCRFYGDGRALIWHDGRCSEDAKFVIKDSYFDSKSPVTLGRYHHNSQFFLINDSCSNKIIDHPIGYAYSDKVLDTISLGNRVYFYNFKRQKGNFAWMKNNLEESKQKPAPEDITPQWTFHNEWDPEAEIKQLKIYMKNLK